jgi:threonine dehydrogenase-like Zn-dependent dehydrogenase
LTLKCPDRIGIVSAVSGFLAEQGCWITEAHHHSDVRDSVFFVRQEIRADIAPGSDVGIVGLGPIGLMAVEIAHVMGAARIFAFDLVPERRAMAETLGVIPVDPANAGETIREATKGRMLQSVVECVGADASLNLSIQLAGTRGTVSSIGVSSTMNFPFPMALAEGAEAYRLFDKKADGALKMVFTV